MEIINKKISEIKPYEKNPQKNDEVVELCCAIGDNTIDGFPYEHIVDIAREYINSIGGFEKFAEWGLF